MKKCLKKLTSLTLAVFLAFTCYIGYHKVSADEGIANVSANAGHFNVTNTTVGTSSTDYGWLYSGSTGTGTITISATGDYTIAKDCTCDNDYVHSSYSIVIEGTGSITVNLTIEDINIENTSGVAMDIDGSAKVTLTFVGDNSFTSSASYYAGIQFNNADTLGGYLKITSNSEDNTLTATGTLFGAGIGSSREINAANITISGGTVIAIGGYGAAIGSGAYASASDITISGGNVTADGGAVSAGIGGGYLGDASNITISGGTVTTSGNVGIGSGYDRYGGTVATNITISGGSVKVNGITITPQNENDENVYLAEIPDISGINSVTVDGTKTYTRNGNHYSDGTFYLYLTGEDHEVIANTSKYLATWDESSLSFTVTCVGEIEISTEGTTGSSSSETTIVDTSTK